MLIITKIGISLNNARIASHNASPAFTRNELEVLSFINQHDCLLMVQLHTKKLHIFCNKKIVDLSKR